MKTYADYIDFFTRERDLLGAAPFSLGFKECMELLRGAASPEADAAILSFAATRQWPPVSDRTRWELCMRLDCGRWYCTDMEAMSEADPGDALEDGPRSTVESLLLDYWHDVGRSNWAEHCLWLTEEDLAARARHEEESRTGNLPGAQPLPWAPPMN